MKKYSIAALLIIFVLLTPNFVFAQQDGEVNFSVKAIIPKNQIDKNQSYFDLRVKPDQKQRLQIMVYNNSRTAIKVSVAANSASTNPGGLISYDVPNIKDESLKHPFSDIARVVDKTVEIPAAKKKIVEVELTMPKDQFDGVVLGGIVIKKLPDDKKDNKDNKGVAINNEYAYVVGAKLSETDVVVAPDLKLRSIEPKLINYKTSVTAKLQNFQPAIIKDMTLDAAVYSKDGNTALQSLKKTGVDVAPNSVFDFIIDWSNKKIDPGEYRLKLTATTKDKKWEWDEPFTIKADKANSVNGNAIELNTTPMWVYVLIGAAILLLLIVIVVYVRKRSRKAG